MAHVKGITHLEEIIEHAAGEIAHVRGTFAQVIILHLFHGGDVTVGDGMESELGVEFLFADELEDFINDDAILEHEEVGVKDIALGTAHILDDAALDFADLGVGLDEGLLKALGLRRRCRHRKFRDGFLCGGRVGGRAPSRGIYPRKRRCRDTLFSRFSLARHRLLLRNSPCHPHCKAIPV